MNRVELVQSRTADGLRLDGALAEPANPEQSGPIDAVLMLHGTGSNFYQDSVLGALTPKLLADGMAVLRVNTRGHDVVSMISTTRGGQRIGGALERVEDAHHDVTAWIEWLVERGYRSIALIGHSLGAVKAVQSVAHALHPAIARLVAISPPRLSYSFYASSEKRDEFFAQYREAEQRVAAGLGDEILNVSFPLNFLFSAANYLDKYGPDEKCNVLRNIQRLMAPALFLFGGAEIEEVNFRGLPEAVAEAALSTQPIQVATVVGANHVYAGKIDELSHKIRTWLAVEK